MTETITTVRQFLEMFTEMAKLREIQGINGYSCIQDFVLRHGREMEPSPLPAGVKRGPMKMCYQNAGRLALDRSDLTYVEGYAASIIPVVHAWCIDKENKVVDPTWKNGREYFGVPISTQYLRRHIINHGVWGILDGWEQGWPLLRAKPEDWRVA